MRATRLCVAPCRSGSTAFFASMTQHPRIEGAYHVIKRGLRQNGAPDYSFFDSVPENPRNILVGKESIGHSTLTECSLRVFQDDDEIRKVAPLFLFRDPVHTWNSWQKKNWGELALFELAYRHAIRMMRHCRTVCDDTVVVSYEKVVASPESQFTAICGKLGIPFDTAMVNWKSMPGESQAGWGEGFKSRLGKGSDHESLGQSVCFCEKPVSLIIPERDVTEINALFRRQYDEICALAV